MHFIYGMGGIGNCKRLKNKTKIHNTDKVNFARSQRVSL